jgi:hypothetical protein
MLIGIKALLAQHVLLGLSLMQQAHLNAGFVQLELQTIQQVLHASHVLQGHLRG